MSRTHYRTVVPFQLDSPMHYTLRQRLKSWQVRLRRDRVGTALGPVLAIAILAGPLAGPLAGYSVLSHEAVIDAAWDPVIKPLLLQRYPTASDAQLREAHAYAYGGCVIQDMGYYPFGNHLFSNLTHYVRTGDFINALVEQSQDMYEYAFALGALTHYAADTVGHPLAVNLSVPDTYPKLGRRFGKSSLTKTTLRRT